MTTDPQLTEVPLLQAKKASAIEEACGCAYETKVRLHVLFGGVQRAVQGVWTLDPVCKYHPCCLCFGVVAGTCLLLTLACC